MTISDSTVENLSNLFGSGGESVKEKSVISSSRLYNTNVTTGAHVINGSMLSSCMVGGVNTLISGYNITSSVINDGAKLSATKEWLTLGPWKDIDHPNITQAGFTTSVSIIAANISGDVNITNGHISDGGTNVGSGTILTNSQLSYVRSINNSVIIDSDLYSIGVVTEASAYSSYVASMDLFNWSANMKIVVPCWTYQTPDCP
jgi:hypothetical protein